MYSNLLRETGNPTSVMGVWMKQLGLGKKFPKAYRKFLRETGGGELTFDHNWLVRDELEEPVSVDVLYGSGKLDYKSLGVVQNSWTYRFTYGMPSGMFAIGEGQ